MEGCEVEGETKKRRSWGSVTTIFAATVSVAGVAWGGGGGEISNEGCMKREAEWVRTFGKKRKVDNGGRRESVVFDEERRGTCLVE